MKNVKHVFCLISFSFFTNIAFAADDIVGFKVLQGEKGLVVDCYNEDKGKGDNAICEQYATGKDSECLLIESTKLNPPPAYVCTPRGYTFCMTDSDCKSLGQNSCVIKPGSSTGFADQFEDDNELSENREYVGICSTIGGDAEQNAIGQSICNLTAVVTGFAGRAVVSVVVMVVGVMFFLGKVTWSLVLAVALGAGAIFGADTIVTQLTGGKMNCRK